MTLKAKLGWLALIIGTATAGGALAAPARCDLPSISALSPADAVIDSVTAIPSPVAHCEVLGHIMTQNPGPNRVEFSVMMPDQRFGKRFYFVGEGAAAGFVPTARVGDPLNTGYLATTLKLLSDGFVVAGSDTGHKGMMWDFGVGNPAARLDHGNRGAHLATVAAQSITKAYYAMGSDKLYRYHLGCSGGGRMGAMAVLHHPTDYDAAVISTGFSDGGSTWFPWIIQELVRNPDSWVSPAKLATLERKVAEHCAGPDGLVRDPKACGFDPATLLCKGADSDQCLTAPELGMVKRVTGRWPTGSGTTIGGFTLAHPTAWSSFLLGMTRPTNKGSENPWAPGQPPASYGIGQSMLRGFYFDDPKFSILDLDFNNPAHMKILSQNHPVLGAVSTDLSAFKKAGGKIMLWAGVGENAVPPATEIEYFNALKTRFPDRDSFIRLYLTPGVFHCAGGPGPQDTPDRLLDKAIAWVEQGKAPDSVVVSGVTNRFVPPAQGAPAVVPAPNPARTVLLCPYPKLAAFNAKPGAYPYDAGNWICK